MFTHSHILTSFPLECPYQGRSLIKLLGEGGGGGGGGTQYCYKQRYAFNIVSPLEYYPSVWHTQYIE